jgi:hypothetical protein
LNTHWSILKNAAAYNSTVTTSNHPNYFEIFVYKMRFTRRIFHSPKEAPLGGLGGVLELFQLPTMTDHPHFCDLELAE